MDKSARLFARAKAVLPGGVNSPLRAFNGVGGQPIFMERAKGAYIYDVDGNEYLDYVGSWGPMLLGHGKEEVITAVQKACSKGLSFGTSTSLEVEMAELMLTMVASLEMVRMVSSGTEAVMSALRLARGYTGKNKIIKLAGCYHGHSDAMLVRAGSGILTAGVADSSGVTPGAAQDTLIGEFNNLSSIEELLIENKGEVAAIIVEPVAANMGVIAPATGFLEGLRKLCDEHGALLIFDEVITGFRLSPGGAATYFAVKPDLVTYGKIIGGGMPVGAYGGQREIMSHVAPVGKVYQAGTLSGNPIAMTAGIVTLKYLFEHQEIYTALEQKAQLLAKGLRQNCDFTVNQIGSLVCTFFVKEPVLDFSSAKKSDTRAYAAFFHHMLASGIYLAPSQFEAMFISDAHTESEIVKTIKIAAEFVAKCEDTRME